MSDGAAMLGAWLGLFGWLLFGFLAFGVRSLWQWWRTGSTGFRGFSGRGLERVAGLLFGAAILTAAAAPILALRGVLPPLWPVEGGAWLIMGCLLYGLGLLLTLWAQFSMGASWRIGVDARERTALVTSGPFRWVRNPIFTATCICTLGLVLLLPSWLAAAALLALIVAIELQVRLVEEPYLLRVHAETYASWASHVGRFFPGLGLGVHLPK